MKNKTELKKCLKITLIAIVILSFFFLVIESIEYKKNVNETNIRILTIIENIKTEYPDVDDNNIYNILKTEKIYNEEFANKYSIDIHNESLVKTIDSNNIKFRIINLCFFIISLMIIVLVFLRYNSKKDKNIDSITKSIEEINRKNYKLDLDGMSEDELSILKNEIYKTTIMLKEQAENSLNDKIKLKDSLSDISHQLKTPLTAIMIRLDNLIDYPDMKKEKRNQFIKEIKIEMTNVNFLVQSILKLSKLDSNTVEYFNKDIKISELVYESIKRVSVLSDLKNININVNLENDGIINCDSSWQIEAISNILKNGLEHSYNDNFVDINIDSNSIYSSICIKDYGVGISKNDLKHIFKRFYKGENSDSNSIGIGLALAKTIIEKNKGTISVESEEGKGTKFIIKYYK